VKRQNQTLEEVLEKLSIIESEWRDETANEVIGYGQCA
jgi:hypothetical protein